MAEQLGIHPSRIVALVDDPAGILKAAQEPPGSPAPCPAPGRAGPRGPEQPRPGRRRARGRPLRRTWSSICWPSYSGISSWIVNLMTSSRPRNARSAAFAATTRQSGPTIDSRTSGIVSNRLRTVSASPARSAPSPPRPTATPATTTPCRRGHLTENTSMSLTPSMMQAYPTPVRTTRDAGRCHDTCLAQRTRNRWWRRATVPGGPRDGTANRTQDTSATQHDRRTKAPACLIWCPGDSPPRRLTTRRCAVAGPSTGTATMRWSARSIGLPGPRAPRPWKGWRAGPIRSAVGPASTPTWSSTGNWFGDR